MYTFQNRIRYSEVDSNRKLTLYSIINYFQDCSNFQSADLGIGVKELTGLGRVWLLSSWQIELIKLPELFDHITIGTWPYDFKGMYGYRNFILYNESHSHEVAAYANSIWFLMDTQSKRPLRITAEDSSPYQLEPAYPMEYAPRKIALPSPASPGTDASSCIRQIHSGTPITVTPMLLDTNHHVNNGQYVRIAECSLPESFRIKSMRVEYRRAAILNDVIVPVLHETVNEGICYVSLNNQNGEPYAIVEFTGVAD